ncbi:hypothetical protein [Desnuesiella massiliensis]|uniref:hypothetical protein n=1 Tax=Desnuesiella massiliensis TaxID=1650662 RepID=UPI0006E314E0|nr:hypothetical protein [Desnuesiella massiliensis]
MIIRGYSEEQLKEAYLSLNDEQKQVLDEHIKQGMKTKWLNILAKNKGTVLTEEEREKPEMAMEKLLDWILLDYEDSLTINPNTRCECGRALRYRYTVLHKSTGKVYKLGSVHFEHHTGFSPELVRLITNGIKEINLERDEILSKVIRRWTFPGNIPPTIAIPKDMVEQLRVNLPLLDRQVTRLIDIINTYNALTQTSLTSKKIELPPIDLSYVDPIALYNKLKSTNISAYEAKELFYFIKYHTDELPELDLDLDEIKKDSTRALGKIGNTSIRKWLVEIEYL